MDNLNSVTDKSTRTKNMDVNGQTSAFISIKMAQRGRIVREVLDFLNVSNERKNEGKQIFFVCLFVCFAAEPTRRSKMLFNQCKCTKSWQLERHGQLLEATAMSDVTAYKPNLTFSQYFFLNHHIVSHLFSAAEPNSSSLLPLNSVF